MLLSPYQRRRDIYRELSRPLIAERHPIQRPEYVQLSIASQDLKSDDERFNAILKNVHLHVGLVKPRVVHGFLNPTRLQRLM
jgi:hypothetical protein